MAANLKYTANEQKFVESMQRMSGSVGKLAADVNIKLNKGFRESDYLARKLDQGFGKLGGQMKNFGRAMSIGVTLPLALAAKGASDAFAEYDSLRRALQSYHPTLDGLNSRLAEMRTLARLPGLGFQEAIQGDVRLQAVGISAKNSSKILREFANAIAQTGGGKAQLNEVTIQLGQMAAKGKVLNQDLRPIIESAPAVATALKNMFGTVSSADISDKLTAAGKTSTEFIEMLLVEMEKAPRVTGGWKNALENLSDALFISKARVFEVTNELFNLNGKVDSFSNTLESLVDGFVSLSPVLQSFLIGLAATATIMGPLSWGIGSLITLLPKLFTGAGLATAGFGGLVLAIGAVISVLVSLSSETSDYNKVLSGRITLEKDATEAIGKEVIAVDSYVKVITEGKASTNAIKSAKSELIKISPLFEDALKSEKGSISKVNDALVLYKSNLLLASKQKLASSKIDALVAAQDKLQQGDIGGFAAFTPVLETIVDGFSFDYRRFDFDLMGTYAKNKASFILESVDQIGREITLLIDEQGRLASGNKEVVTKKFTGLPDPDDAAKAIKDFFTNQKNVLKEESEKFLAEQARLFPLYTKPPTNPEFGKGTKTKTSTLGAAAGVILGDIPNTFTPKAILSDPPPPKKTPYQTALDELKAFEEQAGEIWAEIGTSFVSNFTQGIASGRGIKGALKGLLSDLGGLMAEYGKKALKAVLLFKGLKLMLSIDPASNMALTKALGLIAAGGVMKGLSAGIPALAGGGVTGNPVLAMIGDNASGKEMVMPWEKTGDFASKIASDLGGGMGGGSMTAVLRGEDIYFSQQRFLRSKG